jgi:MarR family transcriptional regulator, organic hydroperoxide resistance regulator
VPDAARTPKPTPQQRALADEVWAQLLHLFMLRRNQFLDASIELGLTPGETNALLAIDPSEPRAMGELATDWRCDASNVTWIVDRLEEKGMVERRTLPTDRRVKTIALTDTGRTIRLGIIDRLQASPPELQRLPVADLMTLRDALAHVQLGEHGGAQSWLRFVHDGARHAGRSARQTREAAQLIKAGAKRLKAEVKAEVKQRQAELKRDLKGR